MFSNIVVVQSSILLIVLLLRISRGTPVALIELNGPQLNVSYRQAKSEEMLRHMNERADPCEDFYEFTCGNYRAADKGPPLTMPSTFNIMDVTDAMFMAELQRDDASDSAVDRKIKTFYKSCLNVTSAIALDTDKVFAFLKVLHKMPMLMGDNWQESDFDWVTAVAEIIHVTGVSTLFGIGPVTDFTDNSITRVGISEPKFFIEFIHLLDKNEYAVLRENYLSFSVYDLCTILGVDEKKASQSAKEMLDFEIALAQGKVDKHLGLQNCEIYNLTTIDEMQQKYLPDLDAQKLLSQSLNFTPSEFYVNHRYVESALSVLKKTPKRVVANYVYFRCFKEFLFQHLVESNNLRRDCVTATQGRFYKQVDNMLYRKIISEDMKEGLHFMWHELKSTFRSMLQSPRLNWMQEDTRKYAVEKLEAMKLSILAYQNNNFEQEFAQLELNDHDYLDNMIALMALSGNRTRAQIHEPPLPEDEGEVASYTPSYSPIDNLIKIPVVLLQQYAKFYRSYPNAVNFGTMGAYIGHEMLHGFDDAGRKYDAKGNSRNWWDPDAATEFSVRTKCFINQYKNYTIGGRHLPKMQMQAENIADNGGVRTAYRAYLQWYEKALATQPNRVLESESLPGLNYTNKQLFFISYGQVWCTEYDEYYTNMRLATDTHVPSKFRVIGPLSNFDEFSKEFNCPLGSAMNPAEKCEIY